MKLSASPRRLLRLIELTLEINSQRNLDQLIDLLVRKIPPLLGATRSTLLLHDRARGQLWSRIATGLGAGEEIRIADHAGLAGYCLHHATGVTVPDAHADPRFDPTTDERTGFHTTNIVSLPIRDTAGQPTAVMQVMNKEGGFSAEDEELCQLLAVQVGIALENACTLQHLRDEHERLRDENSRLRHDLKRHHDFPNLVGTSPAFTPVLARVRQVAPTAATVFLTGETGTGKEIIARLIHYQSPRADRPFVAINCGAVPSQLLESELFGYERGAFTGAVDRKLGLFEAAHDGTIFLDEVGDLPLDLQGKLLRVLQEGEIRRLGSTAAHHVDVRLIAATNQELRAMVQQGRYREDLYYRLNVVPIELPPLRARREDIPLLVAHFVAQFSQRHDKPSSDVSSQAMDCLLRYPFPGNIRELENAIERAVVLAAEPVIGVADLPPEIQGSAGLPPLESIPSTNEELKDAKRAAREEAQRRIERRFLTALLRSAEGNVTRAAAHASMNRSLLQEMLSRHGLNAEDFRTRVTAR